MSHLNKIDTRNLYRFFYGESDEAGDGGENKGRFGYVFGRPMKYTPITDPNDRVFQQTMLRNHTIVNMIPGIPHSDGAKLSKAKEIIENHAETLKDYETNYGNGDVQTKINNEVAKTMAKLVQDGCDLRYLTFKDDVPGFARAFSTLLNTLGAALFNFTDNASFALQMPVSSDAKTRGFKFWTEKSTSISEDANNNFQQSIFANFQKSASNIVKQLRFAGVTATDVNAGENDQTEYVSKSKDAADMAHLTSLASNTLAGSMFQFPDVYDSSEFARNYNISFKFQSPYGDDSSIFYLVLVPFIFLCTFALAKQDGPSGTESPFLCQIDAPGYFSCPMGVVTSLSFTKGGDDRMFNRRGLPLVIEGTMTVRDLYSQLSLPLNSVDMITNFGTAAFLHNMAGLTIFDAMDASAIIRQVKGVGNKLVSNLLQPYISFRESVQNVSRYFGISLGASESWLGEFNIFNSGGK